MSRVIVARDYTVAEHDEKDEVEAGEAGERVLCAALRDDPVVHYEVPVLAGDRLPA